MHIRIGTRGSKLALAQTAQVEQLLKEQVPGYTCEVVPIKTSGDILRDKSLRDLGGKGLFLKEIEEQLIAKKLDIAVHSIKDVPGFIPESLCIECVLPPSDPRDALISPSATGLKDLAPGAIVGTCSPRRQAQILFLRPDLTVMPLRGNINTRIAKVIVEKQFDAAVLAMSGLIRSNLLEYTTHPLPLTDFLPAIGQGVIGVECRRDDTKLRDILSKLNDKNTYIRIEAERSYLQNINGDCNTPIAAFAEVRDGYITLDAAYYEEDGSKSYKFHGSSHNAQELGQEAVEYVKQQKSL